MDPIAEQRKHRRHTVDLQGVLSSATAKGERCIVRDISLGGCRIASATDMSADTTIQLQIKPQQSVPIYIPSATVRWIRGAVFGVQFQEVPEQETKALTRLLWSLPPLT